MELKMKNLEQLFNDYIGGWEKVKPTKSLIFGSQAIKYHFNNYTRIPSDTDYISPTKKILHHISSKQEHHWHPNFQYILDNNIDENYVDPNFLFTIKASHLSWDINWDKHMKDYLFLKENNCTIDMKLYNILYQTWEELHGKKKVDLTGNNYDFFSSTITRKYNHDELHEIVKFYDKPLHTKIRKNQNSPYPSEELWNQLSNDDKLKCALEEIYVITLERYSNLPIKHGVTKSTKNLITSMTKGWFNLFLIDNFDKIIYTNHSYLEEVYLNLKGD